MKVIICGAGMVGFSIARQLAAEDNDVVVIDTQADLVHQLSDTLDVRGEVGHASHPEVLSRAGAADTDLIVAVTFSDEVNMMACQVCHSLFKVPVKIARVRSQSYLLPEWQDLFTRDHMPIDQIISPEREVARSVVRRLKAPGTFETVPFFDDLVRVVGVRLEEDCPVVNTPLRQLTELFPDLNAVVIGIYRNHKIIVPKGDDQMFVGDDVYLCVTTELLERTLSVFGHEETEAQRILILGGGNVGLAVAQSLEAMGSAVRTKLIELDKARAEYVADQLERTVVLHGDALNKDLLFEANAAEAEAVVALTNDDETNILASVLAKEAGAGRALTLINNESYRPVMRPLNIDAFINPRSSTISSILQHMRRGRIRTVRSFQDGAAEVVEAEALETSPLVGKPLSEVDLQDGMIIGAIFQDGKVLTPRGETRIKPGDRVILFSRADLRREVEQLFRVTLEFF